MRKSSWNWQKQLNLLQQRNTKTVSGKVKCKWSFDLNERSQTWRHKRRQRVRREALRKSAEQITMNEKKAKHEVRKSCRGLTSIVSENSILESDEWAGGRVEKEVQETVDFLVCQKHVVLFPLLTCSSSCTVIITPQATCNFAMLHNHDPAVVFLILWHISAAVVKRLMGEM